MIRAVLICLALTGCVKDPADQGLHYAAGYAMAREMMRDDDATPRAVIEAVMTYARAREETQHPGRCGEGCQRDLKYWRKGAEAGSQAGGR